MFVFPELGMNKGYASANDERITAVLAHRTCCIKRKYIFETERVEVTEFAHEAKNHLFGLKMVQECK